jgi:signal transduction histidine kinase
LQQKNMIFFSRFYQTRRTRTNTGFNAGLLKTVSSTTIDSYISDIQYNKNEQKTFIWIVTLYYLKKQKSW